MSRTALIRIGAPHRSSGSTSALCGSGGTFADPEQTQGPQGSVACTVDLTSPAWCYASTKRAQQASLRNSVVSPVSSSSHAGSVADPELASIPPTWNEDGFRLALRYPYGRRLPKHARRRTTPSTALGRLLPRARPRSRSSTRLRSRRSGRTPGQSLQTPSIVVVGFFDGVIQSSSALQVIGFGFSTLGGSRIPGSTGSRDRSSALFKHAGSDTACSTPSP